MTPDTVLLIHAAATWFMAGLIWFVQVVHYPLFGAVGRDGFAAYERRHQRRTAWVVGPVMLMELVTGVMLVVDRPDHVSGWAVWAGLGLLGLIWLSTAALQVPRHRQLETGYDAGAHRALVATNWFRTIAWTARGVLVGVMLSDAPGPA